MKVLKSIEMIKSRVYLHPGRWIKCFMVFILSINLLLLFSLFEETNTAFGAVIEAHGLCAYNELPEEFDSTPPPDRRDFNAGEQITGWLIGYQMSCSDSFSPGWSWWKPDGTYIIPKSFRTGCFADYENKKALMYGSYFKHGAGDDEIGLPDIPGEWSVDFNDCYGGSCRDLYVETFTVIGDGTTTTTSENISSTTTAVESSTTTSANDMTTSIGDGTSTTTPVTTSIAECSYGSCVSTSECTEALGSGWVCNNGCCEQVSVTTTTTNGDCGPGCPDDWIGDDECDDVCNVSECNYDDGDCDGPCTSEFIYGGHVEETEILRYVRDNVLSQTPAGQEIIRLYYQWSPVIVEVMEQDEEFKEDVKGMIDGVLEMIE